MGRKSNILKLAPELRTELDRLLSDESLSNAQIVEHMQSLGANVSDSSVYRYGTNFKRLARDVRRTREIALAFSQELTDMPNSNAGRLIVESLQTLLVQARCELAEQDEIDDRKLARLTRSARDLAAAMKASTDNEFQIRDRVLKEAAKSAARAAAEQGLTGATIDAIKSKILGMPQTAPSAAED